jgi:hypothetical protein
LHVNQVTIHTKLAVLGDTDERLGGCLLHHKRPCSLRDECDIICIMHPGADMAITRQETLRELNEFMFQFPKTIARLYNEDILPALWGLSEKDVESATAQQCDFERTYLWSAVSAMYDYGCAGIDSGQFGAGPLEGGHADAELFINCLPALQGLLVEDHTLLPERVIRAVRTAVARHILEGGKHYADHEASDLDDIAVDHLSINEVALLADMDERSVRNACNPKTPGALQTVAFGKRTMVTRQAAKLWLQGRKGYVPLSKGMPPRTSAPNATQQIRVELPTALAEQVRASAAARGLSLDAYLVQQLST